MELLVRRAKVPRAWVSAVLGRASGGLGAFQLPADYHSCNDLSLAGCESLLSFRTYGGEARFVSCPLYLDGALFLGYSISCLVLWREMYFHYFCR